MFSDAFLNSSSIYLFSASASLCSKRCFLISAFNSASVLTFSYPKSLKKSSFISGSTRFFKPVTLTVNSTSLPFKFSTYSSGNFNFKTFS